MADNYLEKQYEDFLKLKAKREAAKRLLWQKQMKAYRKGLSKDSKEPEE